MNIISYLLFNRSQKQLSQCFSFPRGKTPKYFPDIEQLTENTKIEYLTHITYFAITVDLLIESLLSKSNTSLHPGVHYLNKRLTKGTPLCIKRARYKRTLFFFHSSFFLEPKNRFCREWLLLMVKMLFSPLKWTRETKSLIKLINMK